MTNPVLETISRLRLAWRRFTKPLTLGVRCLVVRGDGHVLLVRHTYLPGWYLPGGGVERGETLEAAVVRELQEEVGVMLRARPQVFHAYSNFREYKSDHVVLFVAREFDVNFKANVEIAEHGFFAPSEPPPDISPATLRRLKEWLGSGDREEMW